MDKLEEEVNRLFEKFNFIVHAECINDLVNILQNEGNSGVFLSCLDTRLKSLELLGYEATKLNSFEKLTNNKNLYSIKFKGKHNIRILYSYNEKSNECLLLSFFEKTGKRKTEYSHYIPTARRRFNELSN